MAPGPVKNWRFAPLDPKRSNPANKPKLEGIVFDVDGTLCEPQNYMFREMREYLCIPKSVDILAHLRSLPPGEQMSSWDKIHAIERRAMAVQKPQPGLNELMEYLDAKDVRKGICTRNFDEPINHLLTTFIPETKFDPLLTRAFHPPKPDPAGILEAAKQWGIPTEARGEGLIMVGDSIDDIKAGAGAGALTVLLRNKENEELSQHETTDICISRLDDLVEILESGGDV